MCGQIMLGGVGGGRKGELSFPDAVADHLLATSINYMAPELALDYDLASSFINVKSLIFDTLIMSAPCFSCLIFTILHDNK